MSTTPAKARRTPKASYEGNPAKLLGVIVPRIKRREPALDTIIKRLGKVKINRKTK